MLQDAIHFTAMLLVVLAFLKITAAWLLHRNPNSSVGAGLDWFLTPA